MLTKLMMFLIRLLPCAFDSSKMNRLHAGTNAIWLYGSPDNVATSQGANYFDEYVNELIVGDIIIVSATDEPDVLKVQTNDGTNITTVALNVT